MIKAVAFAMAIGSLALAGCSGTPQVNPAAIQQIISDCTTACEFVPTVESVTQLFSTSTAVSTVGQAVNMICDAFKQWEAAQPPLPKPPVGMVRAYAPKIVVFDMKVGDQSVKVSGVALKR